MDTLFNKAQKAAHFSMGLLAKGDMLKYFYVLIQNGYKYSTTDIYWVQFMTIIND